MTVGHTEGPTRHFTANSNAMQRDLRVTLDSNGYLILAGAQDTGIGTLEQDSEGDITESVGVRLAGVDGTTVMIADGTADANDYAYAAAGGKVSKSSGGVPIGRFLTASTADGDRVEVLPIPYTPTSDPIDGSLVIDEDFIGDWPANGTALSGQGSYSWTKGETNGTGVTSIDLANGVLAFSFDAVAEAALASLYMANSPVDPSLGGTVEFLMRLPDIGDAAALDLNWGMASDNHATDFDAIAEFVAFHIDGADYSLKIQSDDGTTDTAITDTTVDLVAGTWYAFKIDFNNLEDVKFYYRVKDEESWTQLLSGTTFDVGDASANWTPIVHLEKTSDDTDALIYLDRVRCIAGRDTP